MNTVRASDYHDFVRVKDPVVSPSGEIIAFVRQKPKDDEEYEATIYTVPLGGDEPEQFTLSEGVDGEPRWSPSGDRLAFVSNRGEDDRPQLWVMPTDGGEARQITNVAGGVSGITWRPDGGAIAFTQSTAPEEREEGLDLDLGEEEYEPEEPDPRVIDRMIYRAGVSYFDGKRGHVYVADLTDDTVERLTDGERDHGGPEWGDSETLYYAVKRTGDPDDNIVYDVVALDLERGERETLFQDTAWGFSLAATSDGRVAYPHVPEDRASMRQTELRVYDRTTDRTVTLTESLDRTASLMDPWHGAVPQQWGPREEQLYFLTPDEGSVVLRRVAGDASTDPEVVLAGERHVTGFDVGTDAVVFVQNEWDHPGDVYVATRGGAEEHRLTRVNAGYLDGRAVCQPEEVRFESEDGVEVQGWVLTPPDFDPEGEYSMVVEIHGGPHAMWTTGGSMWHEFQSLAARGYVVFWSNPRGSVGYGEEFAMAIERDWGEVTMADVLAGTELIADRDYVDEENVFVTGGSFGGYMTAWIVGQTDRFAGAVAQRGVYDLSSFYGSTDAFKLIEWDYVTLPWDEPEYLWEHSPVAYADDVTTPTLLIHSDLDFRVPVNNAEMLYLFYRKNGVDTRLVRYPREGHELSRSGEPGHVVDRLERIARWFDGYSDHHDAPPALEREADADLSAGEDDTDEADEEGEGSGAGEGDEE